MTIESEYAAAQIDAGAHLIPAHMLNSVRLYVLRGVPPGGFLTAVLSNDLSGAAGKADDENFAALGSWARFLYNYVPSGCHGSTAKVDAWISKGGLEAREAEAA